MSIQPANQLVDFLKNSLPVDKALMYKKTLQIKTFGCDG